ncbi:MAG: hypothetical protein M0R38_05725 [Bacteroidia bacterium]|nr:hypothetical protein [Bacteroidia bacterium]
MKSQSIRIFIILLHVLLLSSCVTINNKNLQTQLNRSNCNQQNTYHYTLNDIPKPIHEIKIDTALSARLTFNSLNIANAIGITDMLTDYIHKIKEYKITPTVENRLDLLEIYQKVNQRIDFASLEISAVSSEIDCEEERANQIAAFIKSKEKETETRLTVGAIVVGALGAVAAGVISLSGDGPDYIGIGTGLTEATLGVLLLLNERKVVFHHKRNILRDIWNDNKTSTICPPSIWYYLNYHNPNIPNHKSLRTQIIESWMSFEQVKQLSKKAKANSLDIYFGEGGKYTADQLENRANMYDQIESVIKLMKQDLKDLVLEMEKLR